MEQPLREKLLETTARAMAKEIASCVDNGKVSQNILGSTGVWIDTDDHTHAIQIWIDWGEENAELNAVAHSLTVTDEGVLQEDNTAEPIVILGPKQ
tara:strand:+ start:105 stop:392 length:288 start_codon:yes stop_codon:yes gene_type:complete